VCDAARCCQVLQLHCRFTVAVRRKAVEALRSSCGLAVGCTCSPSPARTPCPLPNGNLQQRNLMIWRTQRRPLRSLLAISSPRGRKSTWVAGFADVNNDVVPIWSRQCIAQSLPGSTTTNNRAHVASKSIYLDLHRLRPAVPELLLARSLSRRDTQRQ
jgi:hypothetical protein